MKKFTENHPALADALDTISGLLAGSLVLPAVVFVWIKEIAARNKSEKRFAKKII